MDIMGGKITVNLKDPH